MDFITSDVQDKVKELIKLVLRDEDVSLATVDKAVRMLRQADDTNNEHSGAIKQRIKQSILTHAVKDSNGPAIVASFEKECDNLRRMGSPLLQPFLAVMEPLSYSLTPNIEYGPRINIIKESEKLSRDNSSSSSSEYNSSSSNNSNNITNNGNYGQNGQNGQNMSGTAGNNIPRDLPSMSYAIAGGLLPIVPPYHTSGVAVDSAEAEQAWISGDVENLLLKDLIYIFQVINCL